MNSIVKEIEALLWRRYAALCDGAGADISVRHVHIDPAKDATKLWVNKLSKSFVLNYVGTVDRIPKVGSLFLCEICGTKLWVSQPSKTVNSPDCVPAWLVPVTPVAKVSAATPPAKAMPGVSSKAMPKPKPTPSGPRPLELTLSKVELPAVFEYKIGVNPASASVVLTLWQLVVPDAIDVYDFANAENPNKLTRYLTRPLMDDDPFIQAKAQKLLLRPPASVSAT
jgi:hypothetical protein